MCVSAACGSLPVVQLLASLPMSTFNKAYTFSEPLHRSCRALVRCEDEEQR
jgi:hypothetical protein